MRTVVFDLDGTLADTSADLIAAGNAGLVELGYPAGLDPVADMATAFAGGRAMLRLGLARAGVEDEGEVDRGFPLLLASYGAAIDVHTRLYPGVIAALDALAEAGFILAVCTNKPEGLAATLLERLGIAGRFAAMLGADTLPVRKPDPEHLLETVRRAGGDPARSILIGDTVTDYKAARNAGRPVVLVGFGPHGAGVADMGPDAVLDHYDDLPMLAARFLPH